MSTPLHIVWSRSSRTNDNIHPTELEERIRKALELGLCDPYTAHSALKSSIKPKHKNTATTQPGAQGNARCHTMQDRSDIEELLCGSNFAPTWYHVNDNTCHTSTTEGRHRDTGLG
jgi:hypothetical protein